MRFEIYPFYSITAGPPLETPPPLLSSPAFPAAGGGKKSSSGKVIVAIVVPAVAVMLVLVIALAICLQKRKTKKMYEVGNADTTASEDFTPVNSLQYDLGTLQAATNNFSNDNKIGQGGFGAVYKGMLTSGQEIAIKRLSASSVQGVEQFKNEAVLVAKLQHRNLVRLLGFCLAGAEKLLVYEFVPNKSLDHFLFDPKKQGLLEWSRRYKIILGIARGMLYLHEDSQLRIIHRDLKASNVLLDTDMNPKISDFGMARIFGVDQTQANTNKVVGTFGYMSPEYAMHGHFSMKSDVYSFGILILEIICGQRNSSFYHSSYGDLLSYAWKLWIEGMPLEFMDPSLRDSYSSQEVRRCIHIGLLCVDDDIDERPTMASIVLMLNSQSTTMPVPRRPTFFSRGRMDRSPAFSDQSTSKSAPWSANDVSITEIDPR
ncbi:Cysteine-rich receptor-like protein kinase 10, variant 2 [Ancistrocladus abbreviatus]